MWKPISLTNLKDLVLSAELDLTAEQLSFWDLIKIEPEKWTEMRYGSAGGGFWVVAIFGREVIWYNDIEDGFNISKYTRYGCIDQYVSNQSGLNTIVIGLMARIRKRTD